MLIIGNESGKMERRVKENGGRKTKKKEDISVNGRTA
jgi:hypothetical protein